MEIKRLEATYTGGGIYIYTGMLEDGNFFYTGDVWDGYLVLDTDPNENWEENDYSDWQDAHKIRECFGSDALPFLIQILTKCGEMDLLTDNEVTVRIAELAPITNEYEQGYIPTMDMTIIKQCTYADGVLVHEKITGCYHGEPTNELLKEYRDSGVDIFLG